MKKVKKTLAICIIVFILMAMFPWQVFAATTTGRLYGQSRIDTAIAVANAGWTTATTAVIAPSAGANLVDALAAAPLAGQENAPILLTENNTLDASTKAELIKLGVSEAYVVGAISQTVVDQLNAMGITASALKGADRIATAAAIASKLSAPTGAFVVGYNALADALSVASEAAAKNMAILIANPDGSLPLSETPYATGKIYILGGPSLVSDNAVAGATRIAGADRYDTNLQVLKIISDFKYDKVYLANGGDSHLVDSLVASVLAAKSNSPIVLTDDNTVQAAGFVNGQLSGTSQIIALGGPSIVSDAVAATLVNNVTLSPATNTRASENWAGYVTTPQSNNSYTSITGSWTVPKISGGQSNALAAQWIGLGGVSTADLLQVGTMEQIENGQEVAQVFWEQLPSAAQTVLNVPVGSTIQASISKSSSSSSTWNLTFTVNSANGQPQTQTIPITLDSSYAQEIGTSAEWISEDPSNQNGQLYPLANMGTVSYNSATVNGQPLNYSGNQVQPFALISRNGNVLIQPTTLGADGESFSTEVVSTNNNTGTTPWSGFIGYPIIHVAR